MLETLKKSIKLFESSTPIELVKLAYTEAGELSKIERFTFEDSVINVKDDTITLEFIDFDITAIFNGYEERYSDESLFIIIKGDGVSLGC